MRELKASTKAGQQKLNGLEQATATSIYELYEKPSQAKVASYEWCYREFLNTNESYGFQVWGANTFGYSAGWYGTKDGENIARVETKDNSYLIWLDR